VAAESVAGGGGAGEGCGGTGGVPSCAACVRAAGASPFSSFGAAAGGAGAPIGARRLFPPREFPGLLAFAALKASATSSTLRFNSTSRPESVLFEIVFLIAKSSRSSMNSNIRVHSVFLVTIR
jgi:hypothetical protein